MACGNGCGSGGSAGTSPPSAIGEAGVREVGRLNGLALDAGIPVEVAAGTTVPGRLAVARPLSLRSAVALAAPLNFTMRGASTAQEPSSRTVSDSGWALDAATQPRWPRLADSDPEEFVRVRVSRLLDRAPEAAAHPILHGLIRRFGEAPPRSSDDVRVWALLALASVGDDDLVRMAAARFVPELAPMVGVLLESAHATSKSLCVYSEEKWVWRGTTRVVLTDRRCVDTGCEKQGRVCRLRGSACLCEPPEHPDAPEPPRSRPVPVAVLIAIAVLLVMAAACYIWPPACLKILLQLMRVVTLAIKRYGHGAVPGPGR